MEKWQNFYQIIKVSKMFVGFLNFEILSGVRRGDPTY